MKIWDTNEVNQKKFIMKNKEIQKKEEQASVFITISALLSLFAEDIAEWLNLSIIQYGMIVVAIIFLFLGVIKVQQMEKLRNEKASCDTEPSSPIF